MSIIIEAPFTDEQVDNLNKFQQSGMFHEFTCICRKSLVATNNGMRCPGCGRMQYWVHNFMADGSLNEYINGWSHNIWGKKK